MPWATRNEPWSWPSRDSLFLCELFGERHPDTAKSLGGIANYTNELGNPKRALELAEQALAILRELFGERHPDTARSLSGIANYTNALGNPKRALELAEQALAIRRELFGERHPDTATSLYGMASYLLSLGKTHQAYDCAQKSFEIYKYVFGPQHPFTLRCTKLLSQINRPGFRGRGPAVKKTVKIRKKGSSENSLAGRISLWFIGGVEIAQHMNTSNNCEKSL